MCSARRGVCQCGVEGVYRGVAECESVKLAVLTVAGGCRLLGCGRQLRASTAAPDAEHSTFICLLAGALGAG